MTLHLQPAACGQLQAAYASKSFSIIGLVIIAPKLGEYSKILISLPDGQRALSWITQHPGAALANLLAAGIGYTGWDRGGWRVIL